MTPGRDEPVFDAARVEDIEALVSVDASSPNPWTASSFATEVRSDPPTVFVLRAPEAIAFVVTRVHADEMDIVNLAVARPYRRRGLGRLLLFLLLKRAAAEGVRTVFLEVREGNAEARELYRSAGFGETQRRPSFYREPIEDAILMRLEIDGTRG